MYHRHKGRSTIGIMMRGFRRPDYDIWQSATATAQDRGFDVITFTGRPLASPLGYDRYANVVYKLASRERFDALLLLTSGLGLYVGRAGMEAFCRRFEGIPLVSLQMTLGNIPSILVDDYQGMREVVDHLIEVHGCRHIAFLRGPVRHLGAQERYRAYLESLEAHDLPVDPQLVVAPSKGWDNEVGIHSFLSGFGDALPRQLDAVVGASAGLAQQALKWLRARGIEPPEDLALASFDDYPYLEAVIPPLTTTHVPFDDMGRRAVLLLLAQLEGETVPLETVVPTHMVVRQSCGCPNQAVVRAGCMSWPNPSPCTEVSSQLQERVRAQSARIVDISLERVGDAFAEDDGRVRSWISELVDSLAEDLGKLDSLVDRNAISDSAFLMMLKRVTTRMALESRDVGGFQEIVSLLRQTTLAELDLGSAEASNAVVALEGLWGRARVLIASVARSAAAATRINLGRQSAALAQVGHTLINVTDMEDLCTTLAEELPKTDIVGCFLVLYEDAQRPDGWANLSFAWGPEGRIEISSRIERFLAQEVLPSEIQESVGNSALDNLVVEPLFVRGKQFGFVCFQVSAGGILFEDQPAEATVYDLLRGYICDALHGIFLYEEARRARQQAEEADQLKSRFLSMVSHELRTPLNLIVSLSEMLMWEQDGHQEEIARIHAGAQHLDGLIRDVLDLASSQVGQLRLIREPLDLRQALEVVALIGEQMAADKGLRWVASIPPVVPKVFGDRTRLRQVALNLVSNAFRFTSEGEVCLSVDVDEDEIVVSVSDTGLGVPVAEQTAIFDEFRQSEKTIERGYGGLGLGLAISRRLVEMHGGAIGVHSTGAEGEGATFYFTLPVMQQPSEKEPIDAESATSSSRTVLLLSKAAGRGERLRQYLSDRGYVVREIVIDGECDADAPGHWLNKVFLASPGALILDLEPASEQGWELMRVFKENPKTRDIPVLFYSLLREKDSGSVLTLDYLAKPMNLSDLTHVLARQGLVGDDKADDVFVSVTVLVVDDEPEILATHTWLLQSQLPGSHILHAANGREALELMIEAHPDLVLLDLMMPEMNGFEVIEEMQNHPDLCGIPTVVLTAKTLKEDAIAQLNEGVAAVLGKGLFSAEETMAHIEAALRRAYQPSLETREIVRRAMAYIHEHYMEPLARKEIAAHVNLSPRHLDRCFCDELDITPIAYLNRFRLRQARRLLRSNTMNISEIANAVGFSDGAYFSRVFRKDMGMSPSDYRRIQTED